MPSRYIIVDDEPLARKLITSHVAKIEGLECVGECATAIEAVNLLRNKRVDLIFLDIQMPEVTGLQLAGSLKNPPAIILTTAHRDFAPEAFDLDVIDYLLKPISFERLLKSVNKYFDRESERTKAVVLAHPEETFIYFKSDRKLHKVAITDIVYVESLDDYVSVHKKDGRLITRENISSLEQKLPSPPFVRIHRSFIVNAAWVKTVSSESVWVNEKELPFGRAFKKAAFSMLSAGSI